MKFAYEINHHRYTSLYKNETALFYEEAENDDR